MSQQGPAAHLDHNGHPIARSGPAVLQLHDSFDLAAMASQSSGACTSTANYSAGVEGVVACSNEGQAGPIEFI